MFECLVLYLLCSFHRWPWRFEFLSCSIVPTTLYFSNLCTVMTDFGDKVIGQLFSMTVNEEDVVKVPSGVWQNTELDFERCLVGRVLTRKQVHLEALERTLTSAWDLTKGVRMQKIGENSLLFQFDHVIERNRVMWRGPWSFDRNLVVLRKIEKGQDPLEVDLSKCEFHVQVTGLPVISESEALAKLIGDALGTFVILDTGIEKSFLITTMRLKVLLDVTKPLRRCMNIEGPRNNLICLNLSYERLSNFCYYCGVMGHIVKDCRECLHLFGESDTIDDSLLQYGDWLRAAPPKQPAKHLNGSTSGG